MTDNGLKPMILPSYGQANEGPTDAAAIASHYTDCSSLEVTISTLTLWNSSNEELMVAMARAGGGNHHGSDTVEDLMGPFQQELELLGNLCLRALRLSATVPDGIEVQVVNDLSSFEGGWRLPDLAWGAEAWAVLRLKVPAGALPPLGRLLPEPRSLGSDAGTG